MARARAPHRLLRFLLLILGLAMVGTVVIMLAAHRFAAATQPVFMAAGGGEPVPTLPDDELFRGEGFEFRHEIEGQPLFFIRAEGIRQDRAEIAHLEQVDLELYRANGDVIRVSSDMADYNQDSKDAKLTGNVKVSGRGLEIETRSLLVSHGGQDLASPTPVAIRYPPNLAGRASAMRASLDNEMYILSGGVHLHSTPNVAIPLRLDTERLAHQRDDAVIRAIGKVRLERAGDVITAETLVINFDDRMRNIKSIRARHGAQASVLANRGLAADRVVMAGEHLLIQFDPATGLPRHLEVDAEGGEAHIERIGADGMAQRFSGRVLRGRFINGLLRRVEGSGEPVILTESIVMADGRFPLRHACARELDMQLLAGEPTHLHLQGHVDLADGSGVYVGGASQADVDFAAQVLQVAGPDVSLYHDDGQVTADAFVFHRKTRQIRAEGRVAALLEERASHVLRATPLGQGAGPIQIEADKASWTLDPAAFVFTDNVRAWRGQNLLFADQLRGDDAQQRVSAAGAVKMSWVPSTTGGAVPGAPIDVTAKRMIYDRAHGELVYSGDVDALQSGRRLRCDELRVALREPDGTAERLACQGNVTLEDPAVGRQVEGDRALYLLASDQIEVTGEPVTVREAGGGEVRCRYFRYETDSGAIEIRSTPPGEAASSAATAALPADAPGASER